MKQALLYAWMFPQNRLVLLLRASYKGNDSTYESSIVRRSTFFRGGISLGRYIVVNQFATKKTVMHEYGHCKQSKYLGWLYLVVIGLPSIVHAALCKCKNHSYYDMWFEKWADKLAKIER